MIELHVVAMGVTRGDNPVPIYAAVRTVRVQADPEAMARAERRMERLREAQRRRDERRRRGRQRWQP